MSISREDFKHLAQLVKLEFTEDEEKKFIEDINEILKYIHKLDELNVDQEDVPVNPYYMENRFREDIVEKSMNVKKVIGNSPESSGSYIIVPKMME